MNLRTILLVTLLLLKCYESECTTCIFTFATVGTVWGYGCELANQVIESESDLITIDGAHQMDFGDENVTWIRSENSRISFFPNRLFEHFPNARRANFDKSQMPSFGQPLNCTYLISLTLAGNLLTQIPDGIFANCNIATLTLNRNNLGSIGEGALLGLNGLISLNLINCNLSSIHSNAFDSLRELERIELSFNNLETLDSNWFKNKSNLISLDLSNNLIEELPIFERAFRLTFLNINNNRIGKTKPKTFEGLGKIRQLRLANNLIDDLQPETFYGLRDLCDLWLTDNRLTHLNASSFTSLISLWTLYAERNQIESIDRQLFYILPALRILNLTGNACADDTFTILRGVNNNPIVPRMGTCSCATMQMSLMVLAFLLVCHYLI